MGREETEAVVARITVDAQDAWNAGGGHYLIDLAHFLNDDAVKTVVGGSGDGTPGWYAERQVAWEDVLDAISHVGWRLHTWAPSEREVGSLKIRSTVGRALFVRTGER